MNLETVQHRLSVLPGVWLSMTLSALWVKGTAWGRFRKLLQDLLRALKSEEVAGTCIKRHRKALRVSLSTGRWPTIASRWTGLSERLHGPKGLHSNI